MRDKLPALTADGAPVDSPPFNLTTRGGDLAFDGTWAACRTGAFPVFGARAFASALPGRHSGELTWRPVVFTGIVENVGTILEVASQPSGKRLRIEAGPTARECEPGASIGVSGVCLTVCARDGRSLSFDVIPETLAKSTLGSKRPRDPVNLERSLRVGDRLDGHFVQGHVDGTAEVVQIRSGGEQVVRLRPEAGLRPYLIPKGSVAVDGVSLTICELRDDDFCVALIPTTIERTTLGRLRPGDRVNIETDVITRTVVHHLAGLFASPELRIESLKEAGFV